MRMLLLIAALLSLLVFAAPASAKAPRCNESWYLHPGTVTTRGSCGQRVKDLQWLLAGHKPNAYTKIKPTFKGDPNGAYGARTKAAVLAYKWRFGYPARLAKSPLVGPYFFSLLENQQKRPVLWVALAARRLKTAEAGATPSALKLKRYELTQVGFHEGSRQVNSYFDYFHLPRNLQWCAIFQGYSMRHVGLLLFQNANPWYVPSIIEWGRGHGWLFAKAKVGSFVLYYGDISHIGYVVAVDLFGYSTVEGNWNNQVGHVHHTWTDHLRYFLRIPGLA